MAIIEIIKEQLQLRERLKKEEEIARIDSETKSRFEENIRKAKEEEYRQIQKQRTEKILKESGVLEDFSQISKNFVKGKFRSNEIICNFNAETPNVMMVWSDNILEVKKDGDIQGGAYFFIKVGVDLNSEDIIVSAEITKNISKSEWINRENVERTLANSFLSPGRYISSGTNSFSFDSPHDSYDGGNC